MPVKGSNLLVFVLVSLEKSYPNFQWINEDAGIFVLICVNRRNKNWGYDHLNIYQDYALSCLKQGCDRSDPRQRFISALDKSKHLKKVRDSVKFPKSWRVYQIEKASLIEYRAKVLYRKVAAQLNINMGLDSDHDYAIASSPSTASQYSDNCSSPLSSFSTDSDFMMDSSDDPPQSTFVNELPTLKQVDNNSFQTPFGQLTPATETEEHLNGASSSAPSDVSQEFSEEKLDELYKSLLEGDDGSFYNDSNVSSSLEEKKNSLDVPSTSISSLLKDKNCFDLSSTNDLDMEDFMNLYDIMEKDQSTNLDFYKENPKEFENVETLQNCIANQSIVGDTELLPHQMSLAPSIPANPLEKPVYQIIIINYVMPPGASEQ